MNRNEYIMINGFELPYKKLRQQKNILNITFVDSIIDDELLKSDFSHIDVYNRGGFLMGSYNGYDTVYRHTDNNLQLSNDGSVYIEPRQHDYIVLNDTVIADVDYVVPNGHLLEINLSQNSDKNVDKYRNKTIKHYSRFNVLLNTYTGYNTVYKADGSYICLSDDGSVCPRPKRYNYITINDTNETNISDISVDGNILTIVPISIIDNPNTLFAETPIKYYSASDELLNIYDGFNTVYKIEGGNILLSNDGSVYKEPREYEYIKIGSEEFDITSLSIDSDYLTISFISVPDDLSKLLVDNNGIVNHYSIMDEEIGNYNSFITIYEIDNKVVTLSADGSVYDPIKSSAEKLNNAKDRKVAEMSYVCQKSINAGVIIMSEDDSKRYSYTSEDQQNLKNAYDLSVKTQSDVPYHADNESVQLYSPQEIATIYMLNYKHLVYHQTYFNQLKQFILSLDDIEEIEKIYYGYELSGEYLDTFNSIMNHAEEMINAIFSIGESGDEEVINDEEEGV